MSRIKRAYSTPEIEETDLQLTIDNYLEELRRKGIGQYRCKTIISGTVLEVEVYPLPKLAKGQRRKHENPSRSAQRNLNKANTRKYVVRLINSNFTRRDMWATLDYRHELIPADEKQAQVDMQNYIRRLKRYTKKHGLPELKYLYVTEWIEDTATGKRHAHHHIVMNFTDRDKAEELWGKGFRPQTRRLKPDDFGLSGLGNYIAKEETKTQSRQGKKRYGYSKNLDAPTVRLADRKITKRDVAILNENSNEARPFFENLYSSYYGNAYSLLDMSIRGSEYHPGTYIYVQMKYTGKSTGREARKWKNQRN